MRRKVVKHMTKNGPVIGMKILSFKTLFLNNLPVLNNKWIIIIIIDDTNFQTLNSGLK